MLMILWFVASSQPPGLYVKLRRSRYFCAQISFFFLFTKLSFSVLFLVQRAAVFSVPVHKWAERSERFGLSVLALSLSTINLKQGTSLSDTSRVTPVPVFKKGSDETEHWAWGLTYFRRNKNFLAEVLQIQTRNLPRSFLITHTVSDF